MTDQCVELRLNEHENLLNEVESLINPRLEEAHFFRQLRHVVSGGTLVFYEQLFRLFDSTQDRPERRPRHGAIDHPSSSVKVVVFLGHSTIRKRGIDMFQQGTQRRKPILAAMVGDFACSEQLVNKWHEL